MKENIKNQARSSLIIYFVKKNSLPNTAKEVGYIEPQAWKKKQ